MPVEMMHIRRMRVSMLQFSVLMHMSVRLTGWVLGAVRVLIVPIYLVWMLIAIVQVAVAGPHGLPQPLASLLWVFSMVAGLAPYALVDYILDRVRRARSRN